MIEQTIKYASVDNDPTKLNMICSEKDGDFYAQVSNMIDKDIFNTQDHYELMIAACSLCHKNIQDRKKRVAQIQSKLDL